MSNQWQSVFKTGLATAGGVVSYCVGGWTPLLEIVLVLIIFDYVTGMIASGIEGKLSSKVGAKGIAKKVIIAVLISAAHFLDKALGTGGNIIRDTVAGFYAANELLSILENAGRSGIKVPAVLQKAVQVLNTDKGADQHDANSNPKG